MKPNQTGGKGWILSSHYLQTFGAAQWHSWCTVAVAMAGSSKKVLAAVTLCRVEIILIPDPPHLISVLANIYCFELQLDTVL